MFPQMDRCGRVRRRVFRAPEVGAQERIASPNSGLLNTEQVVVAEFELIDRIGAQKRTRSHEWKTSTAGHERSEKHVTRTSGERYINSRARIAFLGSRCVGPISAEKGRPRRACVVPHSTEYFCANGLMHDFFLFGAWSSSTASCHSSGTATRFARNENAARPSASPRWAATCHPQAMDGATIGRDGRAMSLRPNNLLRRSKSGRNSRPVMCERRHSSIHRERLAFTSVSIHWSTTSLTSLRKFAAWFMREIRNDSRPVFEQATKYSSAGQMSLTRFLRCFVFGPRQRRRECAVN